MCTLRPYCNADAGLIANRIASELGREIERLRFVGPLDLEGLKGLVRFEGDCLFKV